MYWQQAVQCDAATDIGLRRKNNEDAFCIHLSQDEAAWNRTGHIFVVADGMGGHAVGELASRIAVETVPHTFLKSSATDAKNALHEAVVEANRAIHERGTQNADFLHMGTTCTSLVLCHRGALIGHIGDSRAYRVRRDRVDQLTFDHSLEWELERRHGRLDGLADLSQHRNIITRSLGPEALVDVDMEGPFPILPGDTFVLCSDGLSNQLSDTEIGGIARELPPKQAARLLVQLANIRGGPDNITALVVRVGDLPANIVPNIPVEDHDSGSDFGWAWLAGFWAGALGMVAGLALSLLGHPVKGSVLLAVATWALLLMAIASFRSRKTALQRPRDDTRTHIFRPHRTAVGLSSHDLCEFLSQIDVDLTRTAQEDGWDVNWKEHDQTVQAAQSAIREQRYAKGVRDLARAVGLIMDELPRSSSAGQGAKATE